MKLLAAAISLQGRDFAVVLATPELIDAPGEADLAIDRLRPLFGGVPVVLLSAGEHGTARYYGDEAIVRALAEVPIDEMPWQEYAAP